MKIGILGAGRIAHTMAETVCAMPGVQRVAIAARDYGRAQAFAQQYGFERSYGSYEELAADPDVELIYIATPHALHYEHARLCLLNGKNVLCEKAFTQNAAQAHKLLALAEEKHLLLTEAIWTRYAPLRQTLRELVDSGVIGRVQALYAPVVCPLTDKARIMDPALAGGALLDMGVYGLNQAIMVLGREIADVQASAVLSDQGIDLAVNVALRYQNGALATILSDVRCAGQNDVLIYGEKGTIIAENITNLRRIRVLDANHTLCAEYDRPPQLTGYEYEVQACMDALAAGAIECPQMPHAETLFVMDLMDRIRGQIGVKYPGES